uniref:ORF53 n=1 Tax=Malaco herpesvirus 4 TaxID=3031800 RepID=A0AA48P7W1_9VIRU|nr:TPA_asm: ORF53 [Malaco herpesvirus 4]
MTMTLASFMYSVTEAVLSFTATRVSAVTYRMCGVFFNPLSAHMAWMSFITRAPALADETYTAAVRFSYTVAATMRALIERWFGCSITLSKIVRLLTSESFPGESLWIITSTGACSKHTLFASSLYFGTHVEPLLILLETHRFKTFTSLYPLGSLSPIAIFFR